MPTIYYIAEPVTITSNVSGYSAGDYAYLYSNDADGAVDYTTVHDTRQWQLTDPAWTVDGWGKMPWGSGAWAKGYTTMEIVVEADAPGLWTFGFIAYDQYGNDDIGTPGEASIYKTPQPKPPAGWGTITWEPNTATLTFGG